MMNNWILVYETRDFKNAFLVNYFWWIAFLVNAFFVNSLCLNWPHIWCSALNAIQDMKSDVILRKDYEAPFGKNNLGFSHVFSANLSYILSNILCWKFPISYV